MDNTSNVQRFLRSEMSFYITVIVAVFSVAAMYFGLQNRIDLLSQKLDYVAANYNELVLKHSALEARVTSLEKDIALIKLQLK